jgi:hypothetical protein
MIVVVASVHGSPGATSWSLLLGAAWPPSLGVERVVLEADLDGGVLGARYGLGVDPGVVSLLASLRRSAGEPVPVEEHGRPAGGGLWLVPGPETGEQARAVWSGTGAAAGEALATDDRVWLVDAGRLTAGSSTLPLLQRSRLALLLCRAGQEDLVQVPARVATLRSHCPEVVVLVTGKSPYSAAEQSAFFGSPAVSVAAAEDLPRLAGAALTPGRARRSWVWRTALDVSADLARRLHTDDGATAGAGGLVEVVS